MNTDLLDDDALLRRYLLRELGDEERGTVEERLLADDDFFELAEAVEGDLLAAYARNEVGSEERRQMIRRLASSRTGHARLALAQALKHFADAPESVTQAMRSFTEPLPFRRPEPIWFRPAMVRAATLAATLAAAVFALSLVRSPWFIQMPPVVNNVGDSVSPVERSSPGHPAPQPPPAQPGMQAESKLPTASPQPTPPPSRQPEPRAAAFVFKLAILSSPRDGSASPAPALPFLRIPAMVQNVELRIAISDQELYPSYRVILTDATLKEVWSGKVRPRSAGGETVVAVTVPAAQLPAGELDLQLTGLAGQNEETVGWASFDVTHGRG
jgi:hypothetical protein